MADTGTATLDFGAGSASASVAVTGQTAIGANSLCDAFMMAVSTADHSADEHRIENIRLRCGAVTAGVGFTIFAEITLGQAWGQYSVKWVWA